MMILDPEELLNGVDLVQEVLQNHPFSPPLTNVLDTVEVVVSEQCGVPTEQIETSLSERKVVLGLGHSSRNKSTFRYILFHEFGHVADRANPAFGYSEELKQSLSTPERITVMELWNVFIDSRLNVAGVFELADEPACYSMKHGWLPTGIEGKLLGHAVMMENQGIPYGQALKVVRECWDGRPPNMWSYQDMVKWVRHHRCEQSAAGGPGTAGASPSH